MERPELIKKLNDIQKEILLIGWNGVIELYHPELERTDGVDAVEMLRLYKHVYENMLERIVIKE